MSYQVLARKWRPRRFADLVGQGHVVRALVNALEHDRLLDAAGFRTAIDAVPNGQPGLSLRVQRDGRRPLTALTGLGYPLQAPELRDEHGRLVTLRSKWSPERFLVDLVREVSP